VKVNGQMVPLRTILKNGDIVEVLTQSSRTPSRDWLKIVATSRAKNKIRHWFRTHLSAEEVDKGRHMVEREAVRMGLDPVWVLKTGTLDPFLEALNCHSLNELMANIGHGEVSPKTLLNRLVAKTQADDPAAKPEKTEKVETKAPEIKSFKPLLTPTEAPVSGLKGITVGGHQDYLIRFARCCTPVPGDAIVGYITRGRGISIHRTDCPNTLQLPEGENRMIPVNWEGDANQVYEVALEVKAKNREKLLADMLLAISEEGVIINEANARALEGGWAQGYFLVAIPSLDHLEKVLKKLQRVRGVTSARRIEPR
jgi:GTP pyrophosphokinase